MAFLHAPHKVAGLLSLLAAILVLVMWYIVLFVAPPPNISLTQATTGTLGYLFSTENPYRSLFIWLAVAPVASIVFGIFYLFGLSRSKVPAIVLLAMSAALGLSAFYFAAWELAVFVMLPSYWGVLCVRKAT